MKDHLSKFTRLWTHKFDRICFKHPEGYKPTKLRLHNFYWRWMATQAEQKKIKTKGLGNKLRTSDTSQHMRKLKKLSTSKCLGFESPQAIISTLWLNRALPSSKNPHFQTEARCTTLLAKMSFICMRMKNNFHIKGCAPTLVLKQRPGGTRKWPIRLYILAFAVERKQPTFRDATNGFPAKWRLRDERKNIPYWWRVTTQTWVVFLISWRKFHKRYYPDLGSDASSVWNFWARFSDVIWTGTSGSVAKCRLFSQAKENTKLSQFQTELFFVSLAKRPLL